MTRLRDAARAKAFDIVLFPALDRLARSIEVQAVLFAEFRRLGIRLEFVGMQVEDSKEGRVLLNLLGSIAEFEREAIRDRTVYGRRKKARDGLVVAPGNAPYGYEPDPGQPGKLRICEPEAEVVRVIYDLYLAGGKGIEIIAAELRRRGIPARKGQWGTTQVARILNSDRYTGTLYYGTEQVLAGGKRRRGQEPIPIPIPAIITPERRAAALAQLRKNRAQLVGRPAQFRYMLTGLLRCGICRARYDSNPHRGKRWYRHSRGTGCKNPELSADAAEKEVWTTLREALQRPEIFREAALAHEATRGARDVELQSRVEYLRKQIAKIQDKEKRLIRLVADDDTQMELVQAQLRQLSKDRRGLADQLQAAEERVARDAGVSRLRDVEALCAQAREGIDQLDERGRVGLLKDLVDEIRVAPDKTLSILGFLPAGESLRPS